MIAEPEVLNARILIVDDQESNVDLLRQVLSEAGYKCIASTTNPREVCALHRENVYDLILLDLQMPGMDGFQVMEGLKTNETDAYLPVLVITAQPGHRVRALLAGARDFVSKPFDLVEVEDAASATCWKCDCSTGDSRITAGNSNRQCGNGQPNCAKAKPATAA